MISLPIWLFVLLALVCLAAGGLVVWFTLKPMVDESDTIYAPRDE